MKPHYFLLLFCFLFTFSVVGQDKKKGVPNLKTFDERPLHFGFLIGFNAMDFRVYNSGVRNDINENNTRYADVIHLKPGLNIGIVSSLRLNKHFNLRFLPGISFGQRDIWYIDENGVKEERPLEIKSTFLEFPLLLKYSGLRMQNVRPFLVGGFNTRFDLAKNKQDHLLLNSLDGYIEAGGGFDFYLVYFRLSVELKTSIGLANVLNTKGTGEPEDIIYTQTIDKLKSRIFTLTFYFE
ncbi:PorT family protein [Marinilabiliaceae bacterium JC017]|nr:PorT family protein [Marinilabiliaceae bacterium JC017]